MRLRLCSSRFWFCLLMNRPNFFSALLSNGSLFQLHIKSLTTLWIEKLYKKIGERTLVHSYRTTYHGKGKDGATRTTWKTWTKRRNRTNWKTGRKRLLKWRQFHINLKTHLHRSSHSPKNVTSNLKETAETTENCKIVLLTCQCLVCRRIEIVKLNGEACIDQLDS